MLEVEYANSYQGSRNENLDRFDHISGDNWSISYLLDGYDENTPHYVDQLKTNIDKISSAQISSDQVMDTLSNAFNGLDLSKGKASAAFIVCIDFKMKIMTLGDVRVYMLKSQKRTKDDSQVQHLIDLEKVPASSANQHPLRRYLRKSIKGSSSLTSLHSDTYEDVESLLLCSDGFWSNFSDDEIFKITNTKLAQQAFEESKNKNTRESDNQTLITLSPIKK